MTSPGQDDEELPEGDVEAAAADVAAEGDVGGEASGEEASHGDPFFVSKSAAVVLKHGILTRYLTPFVSKVGSTSTGHRVALLDGYAGPGRYEDGTPGSPALLATTARTVQTYRTVECHFVEQKRASHRLLTAFLEGEGSDLSAKAYLGRVEQHLDTVLAAAAGRPLFAYLDPFGFGVPFEDVVRLLRRYTRAGEPPTEVLLNFTATGSGELAVCSGPAGASRLPRRRRSSGGTSLAAVLGGATSCGSTRSLRKPSRPSPTGT